MTRYGWYGGLMKDGNTKTSQYAHQVGQKLPNPFGLHDMHGNVGEWCEDVLSDRLPGGTNPLVTTGSSVRVQRGGSWPYEQQDARSANREAYSPDYRDSYIGFRILRPR